MRRTFKLLVLSLCSAFAAVIQGAETRPNILFIVSDDLNTRIGPYSDLAAQTPHLDRLAGEGVRFTRAYCQYPICGPSRASFMSGLYPESNGVLSNHDELGSYRVLTPALADHPSMAGFFRERGYFSARVSKIFHMGVPGGIERGDPGGDDPHSWDFAANVMGPETMSPGILELLSPDNLHYGSNFARMVLPDGLETTQTDVLAVDQAIAILENRLNPLQEGATNKQRLKPHAPFFLGVGLVRPHVPLIAPERHFRGIDEAALALPDIPTGKVPDAALRRQNARVWGMSPEQQRKTIEAYLASIRFMDEQVGRLLDALDRLGARENTIVLFISDHGYNLGEHGCWSKISLWEDSIRVPIILSAPGFQESRGARVDSVVELIDLYPTLVELAGYAETAPPILQGRSLVPFLRQPDRIDPARAAYVVTNRGVAATLVHQNWKYTRWGKAATPEAEELYHLAEDPHESHNLVHDPAFAERLHSLRTQFDAKKGDMLADN